MRAILDLLFLSVAGALLGVRAHELRGNAGVEPAEPLPPHGTLRRLRLREAPCANVDGMKPKRKAYCEKACAGCANIHHKEPSQKDALKADCEAKYCATGITAGTAPKKGCARSNLSAAMKNWCADTCKWCAGSSKCMGKGNHPNKVGSGNCETTMHADTDRCAKVECGSGGNRAFLNGRDDGLLPPRPDWGGAVRMGLLDDAGDAVLPEDDGATGGDVAHLGLAGSANGSL